MRFKGLLIAISCLFTLLISGGFSYAASLSANQGILTYSVQSDDTYWFLAQRFGTSVAQLQQFNSFPDYGLAQGQVLMLPVSIEGESYLYHVQSGDTLYLISLRTGRQIQAIKEASGLTGDGIYPQQALHIPLNVPGANAYLVRPGDSLYLIAKKFNTTVAELSRFNGLQSDLILEGQVLQVPLVSGNGQYQTPQEPQGEIPVYRVKSGDSLDTIAWQFKTTEEAIYQTNRLNSDIIMPGQPLYIPAGSTKAVEVAGPRGEQNPGFGEFLDWEWARWIYNVGAVATVTDLNSGLSFKIRYLGGSNHADSEPLTAADTAIMKKIFNGSWSWDTRAVLLKVGNRVLAASMAGQPHSVQTIYNNNFPGQFCLYFWNSRSHNTNEISPAHQQNVLRTAGML